MKNNLRAIFSVVLAVTVIAACAPAATPVPPTAAPKPAAQSKLDELYQAAKKAGEGEVVMFQSLVERKNLNNFVEAFEKAFPGIKLTINEAMPAEQSQRVVTESEAKRVTLDIAVVDVSAGKAMFDRDLVLTLDYAGTGVSPSDILLGGKGVFGDVNMGSVIYNTKLVPENEVPKTWQDLLDPKWQGKIGSSKTAGGIQALAAWNEADVEKYMQAMGKQKVKIYASGTAVVQAVAQGEIPICWGVLGNAAPLWQDGAPIKVAPINPIYGSPTYFVAVKNSPHPNAAKLFMAWLGTPEAKKGLADAGMGGATPCEGSKPVNKWLCGGTWTFLFEDSPEMVAKAAKVRELAIKYVTSPTQ